MCGVEVRPSIVGAGEIERSVWARDRERATGGSKRECHIQAILEILNCV